MLGVIMVPLWTLPLALIAVMSVAGYIEWKVNQRRSRRAHAARRAGRAEVLQWQQEVGR